MRYGRLVKVTTVSGSDRTEVVYVVAQADAAAAESHQGSNRRALGGVAGHAGIFTTARDLGRFARSMMAHIRARLQEYCPARAYS